MNLKHLASGNEYFITLTLTNSGGGISADSGSGENYSPGGGIDY